MVPGMGGADQADADGGGGLTAPGGGPAYGGVIRVTDMVSSRMRKRA